MKLNKYKLRDLIEQRREKNNNYPYPIRGVSREGFIKPKQKDADTSLYNVFYKNDFVFNPARMEINSIALNTELEKGICSSLYEIFYVKNENILLPEYLNLFIKRDEFARRCEFIGWGSAREYCRVGNISDIEIELPDIEIQKKYVAIYKSMLENQKNYERGLEDLKLTCDAYIENVRRKKISEPIGKFIKKISEKNIDKKITKVMGLSTKKEFREPQSRVNKDELKGYKIVHENDIAYVPTTDTWKVLAFSVNHFKQDIVVSPIYEVFSVNNERLLSDYLAIWLKREEFDRYARFNSWGSARENFSFDEMCEVKIPIPDIEIQQDIVKIYKAYILRKEINERLKEQIKNICPILLKGSLEEAKSN